MGGRKTNATFGDTNSFRKITQQFDAPLRARLFAVKGNFEDAWGKAKTPDDIPKMFDFKRLGHKSRECSTYQIRGLHKKYRFTLCHIPVADGPAIILWMTVWAKHSNNDRFDVKAAQRICKNLCQEGSR